MPQSTQDLRHTDCFRHHTCTEPEPQRTAESSAQTAEQNCRRFDTAYWECTARAACLPCGQTRENRRAAARRSYKSRAAGQTATKYQWKTCENRRSVRRASWYWWWFSSKPDCPLALRRAWFSSDSPARSWEKTRVLWKVQLTWIPPKKRLTEKHTGRVRLKTYYTPMRERKQGRSDFISESPSEARSKHRRPFHRPYHITRECLLHDERPIKSSFRHCGVAWGNRGFFLFQ